MIIFDYASKKELSEAHGSPLRYTETSIYGPEYVENGTLIGTTRGVLKNYPGRGARSRFAKVVMTDGLISAVM